MIPLMLAMIKVKNHSNHMPSRVKKRRINLRTRKNSYPIVKPYLYRLKFEKNDFIVELYFYRNRKKHHENLQRIPNLSGKEVRNFHESNAV